MLKEEIVDYLNEHEDLKPGSIERELRINLNSSFITSIFGPRRAGKTYYLLQLAKRLETPLYLNFEDSRLREVKYNEIRDVIRVYIELHQESPKTLLLDEVQNIRGWEIIVRELQDLRKYKIFVTGSSSKLLSKEIATQLRGRTLSYLLLPFSFREFLNAKGMRVQPNHTTKDEAAKIRNMLLEYLEFGGFPEVVLNEDKIKILKEYADLALFKDFIERNQVKNITFARYLHESVLQNFSTETSARSIFQKAKGTGIRISNNTIYDYLDKLQDTVTFFFMGRYSKKAHIRSSWPKKIYLADTGLSKVVRFSQDKGKLLENAVFLELMRDKNKHPLLDPYYLKGAEGEVDFVVKEGTKIKILIQVTYASSHEEINKREIRALLAASKATGCRELVVLTWNYDGITHVAGRKIVFRSLWKWLLEGK